MSSGEESQNALILLMFSFAPEEDPILLALDSFRSRPSYRLPPPLPFPKSTSEKCEYDISDCERTSSNRLATSFSSTVVATVDCDGVRLNSGLGGSEGPLFILTLFPLENNPPDETNISVFECWRRPGASCSSFIECFREYSFAPRASERFRLGVPPVGESGTL